MVQQFGHGLELYRDNIEEEFTAARVSGIASAGKNPLAELTRVYRTSFHQFASLLVI